MCVCRRVARLVQTLPQSLSQGVQTGTAGVEAAAGTTTTEDSRREYSAARDGRHQKGEGEGGFHVGH